MINQIFKVTVVSTDITEIVKECRMSEQMQRIYNTASFECEDNLIAKDIMGSNPKCINNDAMAVDAMELMELNDISQLLVEENGKYVGVVHLHNLIKEGII